MSRLFVSVFLGLVLSTVSAHAEPKKPTLHMVVEPDVTQPYPDPDEFYDIVVPPEALPAGMAEGLDQGQTLDPPPLTWEKDEPQIFQNALRLRARLIELVRRKRQELSDVEFRIALEKDELFIKDEQGKGQLNTVDRQYFDRIVDKQSEISLLFLNEATIDPDSRHLARVIARQHIDAGRARPDKQIGRDVVLVWVKDGQIQRKEYRPRFRFGTPHWWKEWWLASAHKVTPGALKLGAICGILQATVTTGVCAVKYFSDHPGVLTSLPLLDGLTQIATQADYIPAVLAAVWGTVLGVFAKSYLEILRRGSKPWQWAKSFLNGIAFAYTLQVLEGKGDELLALFTLGGAALHAHVLSNAGLRQWAKVYWSQLSNMKKEERVNMNADRLPGNRDPNEIDPDAFDNQIKNYLPQLGLGMLDLTGVPIGKYSLIASIPVVQWLAMHQAKKKMENASNPEVRAKWEVVYNRLSEEWGESIWRRPDLWMANKLRSLLALAGNVKNRCLRWIVGGGEVSAPPGTR